MYIGIDLGTSSIKLLLMSENGDIIKSASESYPIYYPNPIWSEQKPEDWWGAVLDGLRTLLKEVDTRRIKGICVSGQMHGLVALDGRGRVIRPAILWNDSRSSEETTWLNSNFGKDRISACTGNIAFAGFTAPKLLWMQRHEPEKFSVIRYIVLPKDYIIYRMTGVVSTDYSDASGTLLLDVQNKRWSPEMLSVCGLEKEQLPELHESYDVVGKLFPEIADQFGLSKECRVVAGAGDNAASAVGTKTVGENACNISLGTSGTIFISRDEFSADPFHSLHSFAHADGRYHLMACMLSAASCNMWWMKNILKTQRYAEEQADIHGLGDNHVFFLPYLMGERSPINDTAARGVFAGLSMDTTRMDMTLAVLEGVAFALRDSMSIAEKLGARIRRSTVTGGGAKSQLWKTILANVLNIELDYVNTEEGPAYGAAILAAVGCGEYSSVEEAAGAIVRITGYITPDRELAEKYDHRYELFTKLYPAMKPIFPAIGQ